MGSRELPREALEAAAHWYVQLNDAATAPPGSAGWPPMTTTARPGRACRRWSAG